MGARNVAFIPVRAGSKSIPLKNIREMAGRPLVIWTLEAAVNCPRIDTVVVSTDSPEIANVVADYGSPKVEIHRRSAESATDTASTEAVMLEYARQNDDFDTMVLIQATSPLLQADDLTRGLTLFATGRYDSLLSVVRQKRFIWSEDNGVATPVNYAHQDRPRRQDFDGYLVENGAFYITPRQTLLETKCRLAGTIGCSEMADETYFEIDEPSDWLIVEGLLAARSASDAGPGAAITADLSRIKALFTDCDGVMTDGGMYYSETGDELKKFQTRDGMGFALLKGQGLITGIITAESVELVERRGAKLKLDEVHLGVHDKLALVQRLCAQRSITLDEVAYIGDDLMDIPLIGAVGFGCSVSDGMEPAREAASYVTKAKGGEGAVREVAELILASLNR